MATVNYHFPTQGHEEAGLMKRLMITTSVVCVVLCITSVIAVARYGIELEQLSQDNIEVAASATISILDNVLLRSWCMIGAIVGAWIFMVLAPSKEPTLHRLASRFVASAASGIIITPTIIHFAKWPAQVDTVAGLACVVAMCALGVLEKVLPLMPAWISKRVEKKVDDT